jgi:APA family basic amino acid/polyamine antiporter
VAILGAFLPLRILAELTNIGTLLAFVMVCISVLIMRYTNPQAHRPFRAPLGIAVPILGIAFCLVLMFSLPAQNWLRLFVWLLIGFVIYFVYGRFHSSLALKHAAGLAADGVGAAAVVGQDPPDSPRAG